ncbi:Ubiquitin-conjugating enzyme/RWD-like protein [Pseudocohnilembus persalinus]|uniref:Ubiquitin-conjugating enzyme/RWD-like protein n=1 Tax=Pseudocohnilembus persalinus TaxID=266149 RepID=A0A0V0QZ87_PSEPJ|nr:Ubiquitin-conjugating enzyme/RWD-like protein [Pseudocohnilembus persalinus]|eukprot:KRX07628.1 Ubiquitin-conjugating enzyme/RWD-like protein [Pseudocohnilembus persalinus]
MDHNHHNSDLQTEDQCFSVTDEQFSEKKLLDPVSLNRHLKKNTLNPLIIQKSQFSKNQQLNSSQNELSFQFSQSFQPQQQEQQQQQQQQQIKDNETIQTYIDTSQPIFDISPNEKLKQNKTFFMLKSKKNQNQDQSNNSIKNQRVNQNNIDDQNSSISTKKILIKTASNKLKDSLLTKENGYGDISPNTNLEILVCVIYIMVGCVLYAYVISKMGTILTTIASENNQKNEILSQLKSYLRKKHISDNLQLSMREYVDYYFKDHLEDQGQFQKQLLSMLSEALKKELLYESYKIVTKDQMFTKNFSPYAITKMTSIIKEIKTSPDQLITKKDDQNNNIYFVDQGNLEIILQQQENAQLNLQNQEYKLFTLKKGDSFGKSEFFTGKPYNYSIKSKDFSTLLAVNREEFIEILSDFPEDLEKFYYIKDQLFLNEEKGDIENICFCCSSQFHTMEFCPYTNLKINKYQILYKNRELPTENREYFDRNFFKVDKESSNALKNFKHFQEIQEQFQNNNNSFLDEQSWVIDEFNFETSYFSSQIEESQSELQEEEENNNQEFNFNEDKNQENQLKINTKNKKKSKNLIKSGFTSIAEEDNSSQNSNSSQKLRQNQRKSNKFQKSNRMLQKEQKIFSKSSVNSESLGDLSEVDFYDSLEISKQKFNNSIKSKQNSRKNSSNSKPRKSFVFIDKYAQQQFKFISEDQIEIKNLESDKIQNFQFPLQYSHNDNQNLESDINNIFSQYGFTALSKNNEKNYQFILSQNDLTISTVQISDSSEKFPNFQFKSKQIINNQSSFKIFYGEFYITNSETINLGIIEEDSEGNEQKDIIKYQKTIRTPKNGAICMRINFNQNQIIFWPKNHFKNYVLLKTEDLINKNWHIYTQLASPEQKLTLNPYVIDPFKSEKLDAQNIYQEQQQKLIQNIDKTLNYINRKNLSQTYEQIKHQESNIKLQNFLGKNKENLQKINNFFLFDEKNDILYIKCYNQLKPFKRNKEGIFPLLDYGRNRYNSDDRINVLISINRLSLLLTGINYNILIYQNYISLQDFQEYLQIVQKGVILLKENLIEININKNQYQKILTAFINYFKDSIAKNECVINPSYRGKIHLDLNVLLQQNQAMRKQQYQSQLKINKIEKYFNQIKNFGVSQQYDDAGQPIPQKEEKQPFWQCKFCGIRNVEKDQFCFICSSDKKEAKMVVEESDTSFETVSEEFQDDFDDDMTKSLNSEPESLKGLHENQTSIQIQAQDLKNNNQDLIQEDEEDYITDSDNSQAGSPNQSLSGSFLEEEEEEEEENFQQNFQSGTLSGSLESQESYLEIDQLGSHMGQTLNQQKMKPKKKIKEQKEKILSNKKSKKKSKILTMDDLKKTQSLIVLKNPDDKEFSYITPEQKKLGKINQKEKKEIPDLQQKQKFKLFEKQKSDDLEEKKSKQLSKSQIRQKSITAQGPQSPCIQQNTLQPRIFDLYDQNQKHFLQAAPLSLDEQYDILNSIITQQEIYYKDPYQLKLYKAIHRFYSFLFCEQSLLTQLNPNNFSLLELAQNGLYFDISTQSLRYYLNNTFPVYIDGCSNLIQCLKEALGLNARIQHNVATINIGIKRSFNISNPIQVEPNDIVLNQENSQFIVILSKESQTIRVYDIAITTHLVSCFKLSEKSNQLTCFNENLNYFTDIKEQEQDLQINLTEDFVPILIENKGNTLSPLILLLIQKNEIKVLRIGLNLKNIQNLFIQDQQLNTAFYFLTGQQFQLKQLIQNTDQQKFLQNIIYEQNENQKIYLNHLYFQNDNYQQNNEQLFQILSQTSIQNEGIYEFENLKKKNEISFHQKDENVWVTLNSNQKIAIKIDKFIKNKLETTQITVEQNFQQQKQDLQEKIDEIQNQDQDQDQIQQILQFSGANNNFLQITQQKTLHFLENKHSELQLHVKENQVPEQLELQLNYQFAYKKSVQTRKSSLEQKTQEYKKSGTPQKSNTLPSKTSSQLSEQSEKNVHIDSETKKQENLNQQTQNNNQSNNQNNQINSQQLSQEELEEKIKKFKAITNIKEKKATPQQLQQQQATNIFGAPKVSQKNGENSSEFSEQNLKIHTLQGYPENISVQLVKNKVSEANSAQFKDHANLFDPVENKPTNLLQFQKGIPFIFHSVENCGITFRSKDLTYLSIKKFQLKIQSQKFDNRGIFPIGSGLIFAFNNISQFYQYQHLFDEIKTKEDFEKWQKEYQINSDLYKKTQNMEQIDKEFQPIGFFSQQQMFENKNTSEQNLFNTKNQFFQYIHIKPVNFNKISSDFLKMYGSYYKMYLTDITIKGNQLTQSQFSLNKYLDTIQQHNGQLTGIQKLQENNYKHNHLSIYDYIIQNVDFKVKLKKNKNEWVTVDKKKIKYHIYNTQCKIEQLQNLGYVKDQSNQLQRLNSSNSSKVPSLTQIPYQKESQTLLIDSHYRITVTNLSELFDIQELESIQLVKKDSFSPLFVSEKIKFNTLIFSLISRKQGVQMPKIQQNLKNQKNQHFQTINEIEQQINPQIELTPQNIDQFPILQHIFSFLKNKNTSISKKSLLFTSKIMRKNFFIHQYLIKHFEDLDQIILNFISNQNLKGNSIIQFITYMMLHCELQKEQEMKQKFTEILTEKIMPNFNKIFLGQNFDQKSFSPLIFTQIKNAIIILNSTLRLILEGMENLKKLLNENPKQSLFLDLSQKIEFSNQTENLQQKLNNNFQIIPFENVQNTVKQYRASIQGQVTEFIQYQQNSYSKTFIMDLKVPYNIQQLIFFFNNDLEYQKINFNLLINIYSIKKSPNSENKTQNNEKQNDLNEKNFLLENLISHTIISKEELNEQLFEPKLSQQLINYQNLCLDYGYGNNEYTYDYDKKKKIPGYFLPVNTFNNFEISRYYKVEILVQENLQLKQNQVLLQNQNLNQNQKPQQNKMPDQFQFSAQILKSDIVPLPSGSVWENKVPNQKENQFQKQEKQENSEEIEIFQKIFDQAKKSSSKIQVEIDTYSNQYRPSPFIKFKVDSKLAGYLSSQNLQSLSVCIDSNLLDFNTAQLLLAQNPYETQNNILKEKQGELDSILQLAQKNRKIPQQEQIQNLTYQISQIKANLYKILQYQYPNSQKLLENCPISVQFALIQAYINKLKIGQEIINLDSQFGISDYEKLLTSFWIEIQGSIFDNKIKDQLFKIFEASQIHNNIETNFYQELILKYIVNLKEDTKDEISTQQAQIYKENLIYIFSQNKIPYYDSIFFLMQQIGIITQNNLSTKKNINENNNNIQDHFNLKDNIDSMKLKIFREKFKNKKLNKTLTEHQKQNDEQIVKLIKFLTELLTGIQYQNHNLNKFNCSICQIDLQIYDKFYLNLSNNQHFCFECRKKISKEQETQRQKSIFVFQYYETINQIQNLNFVTETSLKEKQMLDIQKIVQQIKYQENPKLDKENDKNKQNTFELDTQIQNSNHISLQHEGYKCTVCVNIIKGNRYECLLCESCNLCENCMIQNKKKHNKYHYFLEHQSLITEESKKLVEKLKNYIQKRNIYLLELNQRQELQQLNFFAQFNQQTYNVTCNDQEQDRFLSLLKKYKSFTAPIEKFEIMIQKKGLKKEIQKQKYLANQSLLLYQQHTLLNAIVKCPIQQQLQQKKIAKNIDSFKLLTGQSLQNQHVLWNKILQLTIKNLQNEDLAYFFQISQKNLEQKFQKQQKKVQESEKSKENQEEIKKKENQEEIADQQLQSAIKVIIQEEKQFFSDSESDFESDQEDLEEENFIQQQEQILNVNNKKITNQINNNNINNTQFQESDPELFIDVWEKFGHIFKDDSLSSQLQNQQIIINECIFNLIPGYLEQNLSFAENFFEKQTGSIMSLEIISNLVQLLIPDENSDKPISILENTQSNWELVLKIFQNASLEKLSRQPNLLGQITSQYLKQPRTLKSHTLNSYTKLVDCLIKNPILSLPKNKQKKTVMCLSILEIIFKILKDLQKTQKGQQQYQQQFQQQLQNQNLGQIYLYEQTFEGKLMKKLIDLLLLEKSIGALKIRSNLTDNIVVQDDKLSDLIQELEKNQSFCILDEKGTLLFLDFLVQNFMFSENFLKNFDYYEPLNPQQMEELTIFNSLLQMFSYNYQNCLNILNVLKQQENQEKIEFQQLKENLNHLIKFQVETYQPQKLHSGCNYTQNLIGQVNQSMYFLLKNLFGDNQNKKKDENNKEDQKETKNEKSVQNKNAENLCEKINSPNFDLSKEILLKQTVKFLENYLNLHLKQSLKTIQQKDFDIFNFQKFEKITLSIQHLIELMLNNERAAAIYLENSDIQSLFQNFQQNPLQQEYHKYVKEQEQSLKLEDQLIKEGEKTENQGKKLIKQAGNIFDGTLQPNQDIFNDFQAPFETETVQNPFAPKKIEDNKSSYGLDTSPFTMVDFCEFPKILNKKQLSSSFRQISQPYQQNQFYKNKIYSNQHHKNFLFQLLMTKNNYREIEVIFELQNHVQIQDFSVGFTLPFHQNYQNNQDSIPNFVEFEVAEFQEKDLNQAKLNQKNNQNNSKKQLKTDFTYVGQLTEHPDFQLQQVQIHVFKLNKLTAEADLKKQRVKYIKLRFFRPLQEIQIISDNEFKEKTISYGFSFVSIMGYSADLPVSNKAKFLQKSEEILKKTYLSIMNRTVEYTNLNQFIENLALKSPQIKQKFQDVVFDNMTSKNATLVLNIINQSKQESQKIKFLQKLFETNKKSLDQLYTQTHQNQQQQLQNQNKNDKEKKSIEEISNIDEILYYLEIFIIALKFNYFDPNTQLIFCISEIQLQNIYQIANQYDQIKKNIVIQYLNELLQLKAPFEISIKKQDQIKFVEKILFQIENDLTQLQISPKNNQEKYISSQLQTLMVLYVQNKQTQQYVNNKPEIFFTKLFEIFVVNGNQDNNNNDKNITENQQNRKEIQITYIKFITHLIENKNYLDIFKANSKINLYAILELSKIPQKTKNNLIGSLLEEDSDELCQIIINFIDKLVNSVENQDLIIEELIEYLQQDFQSVKKLEDKEYVKKIFLPLVQLTKSSQICIHYYDQEKQSYQFGNISQILNNSYNLNDENTSFIVNNSSVEPISDIVAPKSIPYQSLESNILNDTQKQNLLNNIYKINTDTKFGQKLNNGAWVNVHTVYKDNDSTQKKVIESKMLHKNKSLLVVVKAVNTLNQKPIIVGGLINRDCETNHAYIADYSFLPPEYQSSQSGYYDTQGYIFKYDPGNLVFYYDVEGQNYLHFQNKKDQVTIQQTYGDTVYGFYSFKSQGNESLGVQLFALGLSAVSISLCTEKSHQNFQKSLQDGVIQLLDKENQPSVPKASQIKIQQIEYWQYDPTFTSFQPKKTQISEKNNSHIRIFQNLQYSHDLISQQNQLINQITDPITQLKRLRTVYSVPTNTQFKEIIQILLNNKNIKKEQLDQLTITNVQNGQKIENLDLEIQNLESQYKSQIIDIQLQTNQLQNLYKQLKKQQNQDKLENSHQKQQKVKTEMKFNIFDKFIEKLGGIENFIDQLIEQVQNWNAQNSQKIWLQILKEIKSFAQLKNFSKIFFQDQNNVEAIINLSIGQYKQEFQDENSEVSQQNKYLQQQKIEQNLVKNIFDNLKLVFQDKSDLQLREMCLENQFIENLLERLHLITNERKRVKIQDNKNNLNQFDEEDEDQEQNSDPNQINEQNEKQAEKNNNDKNAKKEKKKKKKEKKVVKKGVGYKFTGKDFDPTVLLEQNQQKNDQIIQCINILTQFLDCDKWNPPEQLFETLCQSCLLPLLEQALLNGSLVDMSKNCDLNVAYFQLIQKMAKYDQLIKLFQNLSEEYIPLQMNSLKQLLDNNKQIAKNANIILQQATENTENFKENANKQPDLIDDEDNEHINSYQQDDYFGQKVINDFDPEFEEQQNKNSKKLADIINETCAIVDKLFTHVKVENNDQQMMEKILKLNIKEKYIKLLKNLTFDYISFKDSKGKLQHAFTKNNPLGVQISNNPPPQQKLVKLATELADLSSSLPCDHTNSIFIRCDKEKVDIMKVLIMGSAGTPYGHGAFLYDVYFPDEYPKSPPKMVITTTGGGSVRFNPNLYENGKVCLSLLGTWEGPQWNSKVSTFYQVLISIQSLVMVDDILFNEPGYENQMGTEKGEKSNRGYTNVVRYYNIKYAMIDQIRNPPKGFETVIKWHFYLKQDEILAEVARWLEEAQNLDADYVSCQNKYQAFQSDYPGLLAQIIEELKEEFKKLNPPSYSDLQVDEKNELSPEKNKNSNPQNNLANLQQEQILNQKGVNLDEIDVTYDKNQQNGKEIDISDEAVKDRWSRYIGAMGIDAVAKQSKSNVFISGMGPLGVEIAKNLILGGLKSITLQDDQETTVHDLNGQFYLNKNDLKKNRVSQCIDKLQQLNFYVQVNQQTQSLEQLLKDQSYEWKKFDIIVLTEQNYNTQLEINQICRKYNIKFIQADICGVFGQIFNDFGDKFEIIDKDGQDPTQIVIGNISNEEKGIVKLNPQFKHPFEDGEQVIIQDVEGMIDNNGNSINGTIHTIQTINSNSFYIGDTTKYSKYIRNGTAKNIKVPTIQSHNQLSFYANKKQEEIKFDENMKIHDFMKINHPDFSHILFLAVQQFKQDSKKKQKPGIWDLQDFFNFNEIAQKQFQNYFQNLEKQQIQQLQQEFNNIIPKFCYLSSLQYPSMAAFMGGIISQEIIKALTNKFLPINQFMYCDCVEILPQNIPQFQENIDEETYTQLMTKFTKENQLVFDIQNCSPYESIQYFLGKQVYQSLKNTKLFMIGCGAIGCELLKNFAMLNLSTGLKGIITVTDPDHIETSNLNRQFLFREKHIKQPKSSTAAAVAQNMNPFLKGHIRAHLHRIHQETKNTYNDQFFQQQTLIANALDNVQARKYVDKRCVENRVPLLESGTLGPKGHVQVILPMQTESYGSQQDPQGDNEAEIPHCTLKMFPEDTVHCIEWARDKFGKIFTLRPKQVLKILENDKYQITGTSELKALRETIKILKNRPKNFNDCILLATKKFYKYFRNDILQLLHTYPPDTKTSDGEPFWKLPKRPPTPILKLDQNDELQQELLAAFSVLYAKIFKIEFPENFRQKEKKQEIAEIAAKFQIPDFVPNEQKSKSIANQVNQENQDKNEENLEQQQQNNQTQNEIELYQKEFNQLVQKCDKNLIQPEEFEKDEDKNGHIDLIYALSNLRSQNYKLEKMDKLQVKLKAGKIVPALATTTSVIAALQTIELVKILKKDHLKLDDYKNAFLNLSVPNLQLVEPAPPAKIKINEKLTVTLWDRWEIKEKNVKLLQIFEFFEKTYGLICQDIFYGHKLIYSSVQMDKQPQKQKELMEKHLFKDVLHEQQTPYLDLTIAFIDQKTKEQINETPPVRIYNIK